MKRFTPFLLLLLLLMARAPAHQALAKDNWISVR